LRRASIHFHGAYLPQPLSAKNSLMNSDERSAYLRELRPYLVASIIFFAVGAVIGAAVASRFPGLADNFGDSIAGFLKTFRGLPKPQLAAAIFLNNSIKTLAAILLGLAIGVVPALFLIINGVVLGVVFFLSSYSRGLWPSLLSILPHGILELTAVFLGTAIGLLLGNIVLKRMLRKSDAKIRPALIRGLRFYAIVIVPMLLVAAMIEAFITTMIVGAR
jgi:stage II sporulation protein M